MDYLVPLPDRLVHSPLLDDTRPGWALPDPRSRGEGPPVGVPAPGVVLPTPAVPPIAEITTVSGARSRYQIR